MSPLRPTPLPKAQAHSHTDSPLWKRPDIQVSEGGRCQGRDGSLDDNLRHYVSQPDPSPTKNNLPLRITWRPLVTSPLSRNPLLAPVSTHCLWLPSKLVFCGSLRYDTHAHSPPGRRYQVLYVVTEAPHYKTSPAQDTDLTECRVQV
jgi:hypothetical protein